jgi:hypothetical protein
LTDEPHADQDEPMTNFPFKDPVSRRSMSRDELADLLRSFEDAWAKQHGERVTSAEFYDRYRAGEIDSMFATSWASYYEIFRRLGQAEGTAALVDSLVSAG